MAVFLLRLNALEWQSADVYVQAGVPCAKFAKWCMREGLSGAEFLAGIPGTMGGALRMNAGAYGGETWGLVQKVQLLDRHGDLLWMNPQDFSVGYRSVEGFGECMFAGALLRLTPSTPEVIEDYTKKMLQKRNASQPIGSFNCGSVFLKGYSIGGAEISQKHANFIINRGDATADDIERLIEFIQKKVLEKTGFALYRECHILGDRMECAQEAVR